MVLGLVGLVIKKNWRYLSMSHSIHSDVSALSIGTKRFDKGPYFNFYHKENNK